MSNTGPITFINSNCGSGRPKGQNFAVLSHVHKHRKWDKIDRLKRTVLQRASKGKQSGLTASQQLSIIHEGFHHGSHTLAWDHGVSEESEDTTKQHEAYSQVATRPSDNYIHCIQEGNSDPFNSATIFISAKVNEYLQLGAHFFVFWAYPAYISPTFRAKAYEDWESSVQTSLGSPSTMHALLAAGALIRAERSTVNTNQDLMRATAHKTQAIAILRAELLGKKPWEASDLMWAILRLLSLDFYVGDFEAAKWHHNAAKEVIRYHKFPDWHDDAFLFFFVAEVWVCTALLKPPSLVAAQWQNQDLSRSSYIKQGQYMESCKNDKPPLNSALPTELISIFHAIRNLTADKNAIESMSDNDQKLSGVRYLDIQAARIKAQLLQGWASISQDHVKMGMQSTAAILSSATTLAALIYIDLIFMYIPVRLSSPAFQSHLTWPKHVLDRAFEELNSDVTELIAQMKLDPSANDNNIDLLFWLSFIASLRLQICPNTRPEINNDINISHMFLHFTESSSSDIKAKLSAFLYDNILLDDYLHMLFQGMLLGKEIPRYTQTFFEPIQTRLR